MPGEDLQKLFNIHDAFAVLIGLRDGTLTHVEQLVTSESPHKPVRYAEYLDAAGIIQFDRETGELFPDKAFFEKLASIDFSLNRLRGFTWSSVIVDPVFQSRLRTEQEVSFQVFVLMPFSDELLPIYQDHIKPTVEGMDYSCGRADDFFTADSVMEDIWIAIQGAQVILADCTGRNPNVFYEIGIAHTVGKPVVLLSQSIEDIPFDLRHRRTILYKYTPRGVKELEKALAKSIEWEMPGEGESGRPTEDWRRFVRRSRE